MRRLNVQAAHLNMCIEKSVYALPGAKKPHMEDSELLLLQLNKVDAIQRGIQHCRTNFALVYDRVEEDPDAIQQLWPTANPKWRWLLYGSATIPTIPFNLDDAVSSQRYSVPGMTNPAPVIKKEDEEKINRYILGALAEKPDLTRQRVPVSQIIQEFGKQDVLSALSNHDHIVRLRAKYRGTANREKCEPNRYFAEILASYYEHRCQVCKKDCSSASYGAAFFEVHYLRDLTQGGLDTSENMVTLCPDHHRIIQVTNAEFDPKNLAFKYPNGRHEKLQLSKHFEQQRSTIV